MRRSLISAAMAFALAVPVLAQEHGEAHEMDQHEMDHGDAHALIEQFEASQAELQALVSGLSAEQWNFKSAEDRWSIAEVVEHITVAEQGSLHVLTEQLTAKDVTDEAREQAVTFEQGIASTLRNRDQKFPAPAELAPTGRWAGGDEVMAAFGEARAAMISFLHDVDFDLRSRFAPHPVVGADLDASGWIVITVEHGMRHTEQIREVMDDAAFPGK